MKIKIVRREIFYNGCYFACYDVYHGFTGLPHTFPFVTKWVCDKVGLEEKELAKYMMQVLTATGKYKVITKAHKDNKK